MDRIKKFYFDLEQKVRAKPTKQIIALYILFIISIIL